MQQLRNSQAKSLFRALRANRRSTRHPEFTRRPCRQDHSKSSVLSHIDDLLLRYATQYSQAVLCRRKSHDRIKRLFENCSAWSDDRELMHRKSCHRLQHPRLYRIVKTDGRISDQLIPFCLIDGRSKNHTFSAVAAIWLQDQTFAILLAKSSRLPSLPCGSVVRRSPTIRVHST